MKRLFAAGILSLVLFAPAAIAEELRSAEAFFDQTFGDLQVEALQARDEGKAGVMIMFESNDCPFCRRMKETVLNRARVQDRFRRSFRIVMLNTEGDTLITDFSGEELTEKVFALKNRARATPVFAFFDTDGKAVFKKVGVFDIETFLAMADYVEGGHYEKGRFKQYLEEHASS